MAEAFSSRTTGRVDIDGLPVSDAAAPQGLIRVDAPRWFIMGRELLSAPIAQAGRYPVPELAPQ
jgi:hypothetical protein